MSKKHIHLCHLPELPEFTWVTVLLWTFTRPGPGMNAGDKEKLELWQISRGKKKWDSHMEKGSLFHGPPGLAYRIIKCNEVLIQSHNTKFHWRQGKQGIYLLHFSPSLKTPASSVSPGPVSILHMCVVTSDMGIPLCKISWIKSYCLLQLHSHHSLHITATANIISTWVISKLSARVFHESQAIVVFSYDVTSREPRLHACSHLQLLPVWPGL